MSSLTTYSRMGCIGKVDLRLLTRAFILPGRRKRTWEQDWRHKMKTPAIRNKLMTRLNCVACQFIATWPDEMSKHDSTN